MLSRIVNLEEGELSTYSRAVDLNLELLRRYRELSGRSLPSAYLFLFPPPSLSPSEISEVQTSFPVHSHPSFPRLTRWMSTLIKITPFNGGNTDQGESVDEYLDDVETAALSWDLTIIPGITEATNKSKIRLFRQNLERDGDAWHWWYYVLPEADKKDYAKIVLEFRDRYGVKASQASSLFAVQNEMLSLHQNESEHIRDYVHRVEKLSRKIPRDMDSLFAIAFIKGMQDQEKRQRVTFDLKDSPNFSFVKALSVVKFSFQEIGEPDPFRPHQKAREQELQSSSLYTSPVYPPVNTVGKANFTPTPAVNSPTLPPLTQEQFNAFMNAYEASIGRIPRNQYSGQGSFSSARRGNLRITCFNCGMRGHYSDGCTNQPLTSYEQQQVRDRVRREREQSEQEFRSPERRQELSPLSGANTVEVTPRAILPRPSPERGSTPAATSVQVACVRTCSVSRSDLGNACVIATRIPAVRTVFENALVEKRARVEEGESEAEFRQRSTKVPRRMGEAGESSQLRRSLRPTNNPLARRRGEEVTAIPGGEAEEEVILGGVGEEVEMEGLSDGNETEEEIAVRHQQATGKPKKSKQKIPVAPINWMKGQVPFTIHDALNGPSPGLNITLPQLLDCSPRLRRDLAELLRSSIPRTRKKLAVGSKEQSHPIALHSSKFILGHEVTSEASPGMEDNIECLYIEAWIGNFKVPEVLVDAGAMLDLVSTQLVDKLRMERFPVSGLGMRLADDRLVVLRNYVWIDIVVAGVLARIKAYEVAVSQTYQLLLSRRWLKRVKAVEYHDARMLFIEGSDRVRRKVPGVPIGSTGIKMENTEGYPFCDVDDEEAEDAIETLLNELDHWAESKEEELEEGN